MTDPVKVSILCTAFNEGLHLEETLDSIRAQTHDNWELLLIDDASTDETLDIMRRHAGADSRIHIVSSGVKLGKVAAFNLAQRKASGDWVVLMGADDVMPPDSLAGRIAAVKACTEQDLVVGYFKLKTMSDDPKFDGMMLPRGERGSQSGPSLTLSRALADVVFPVPEQLPSEDTWLGELAAALAEYVVHSQHVVVHYRIHAGNSNPRHKSFDGMDQAMFKRAQAYSLLLTGADRLGIPPDSVERFRKFDQAERWRHERSTIRILLGSDLSLIDRLAIASMSQPVLYAARRRFYGFFSGRRGR